MTQIDTDPASMPESSVNSEMVHPGFTARVADLPVVHSLMQKFWMTYADAKNYSPVLATVLDTSEAAAGIGAEMMKPVLEIECIKDKVSVASGYACTGLDFVQEKLPPVNMTPEELRTAPQEYYNGSVAQKTVQAARGLPEYSQQKYNDATESVHSGLDYADSIVKHYLAAPLREENEMQDMNSQQNAHEVPVLSRVADLTTAASTGVQANAQFRADQAKQMVDSTWTAASQTLAQTQEKLIEARDYIISE